MEKKRKNRHSGSERDRERLEMKEGTQHVSVSHPSTRRSVFDSNLPPGPRGRDGSGPGGGAPHFGRQSSQPSRPLLYRGLFSAKDPFHGEKGILPPSGGPVVSEPFPRLSRGSRQGGPEVLEDRHRRAPKR